MVEFLTPHSSRHTIQPISDLVKYLRGMHVPGTALLVAIDGPGASGKTTLSSRIAEQLPKATIIHLDDFWKPSSQGNAAWKTLVGKSPTRESGLHVNSIQQFEHLGYGFDVQRLQVQVLDPLQNNRTGQYQKYDWDEDRLLDEFHTVFADTIIIVEGATIGRKELRKYFNFTIWIDCDRETRLTRALGRDGFMHACWTDKWEPEWDRYVALHQPQRYADLCINSSEISLLASGNVACTSQVPWLKDLQ